jgi:hypothetical protein
MSDEGVLGGYVFVVPAAGGEALNLTPSRAGSPSFVAWLPSSREILFAEHAEGGSGWGRWPDGTARTVWRGASAQRAGCSPGLRCPQKTAA